jgi:hypothetical protein
MKSQQHNMRSIYLFIYRPLLHTTCFGVKDHLQACSLATFGTSNCMMQLEHKNCIKWVNEYIILFGGNLSSYEGGVSGQSISETCGKVLVLNYSHIECWKTSKAASAERSFTVLVKCSFSVLFLTTPCLVVKTYQTDYAVFFFLCRQ